MTTMYTLLITAAELHALRQSAAPLMVFDCSFELADTAAGRRQYEQAHIPGAVYASLDTDLSAPHGSAAGPGGLAITAHGVDEPASGGRHPLPSRERFRTWLSSVGFANGMQAVVYDRNGSSMCARLWWMLKWAGHDPVAVLDGGLAAWQTWCRDTLRDASGGTAAGAEPAHFQSNFELHPPLRRLVSAGKLAAHLGDGTHHIVDARAPARYRGEVEPLDPVAGHIPGALNRPFTDNFAADGRFKPAAALRAEIDALLAGRDPERVVHHCGSGVTALPNVLAMELAGYPPPALFAGSWSEWVSDPARPVARG